MYRKINDHKHTASITKTNEIRFMFDDGWDDLLDCTKQFKDLAAAQEHLSLAGYEEFDPNADLKAQGFVWNGYCYAKP